ncbi:hypothetical protein KC19_10G121900 [Ceratodon purpureus]|uniref:Uncharacterized protein n=1 Tax=Ceratodon purpureus TaxID=3225 RepID=A0A8T0GM65_CERPU|nr:hypothetical protein KC19_10G121900 [Ceratodon purpureus]
MHLEVPLRSMVMVGMHWKWPCLSTLQTLHPMLSPTYQIGCFNFHTRESTSSHHISEGGSFFVNQEMLGQSQAHWEHAGCLLRRGWSRTPVSKAVQQH